MSSSADAAKELDLGLVARLLLTGFVTIMSFSVTSMIVQSGRAPKCTFPCLTPAPSRQLPLGSALRAPELLLLSRPYQSLSRCSISKAYI